MTDLITRTFATELEVRTTASGEGRTVFGVAVPYGVPQYIYDGLTEEFVRGAFSHQSGIQRSRVRLAREHVQLGGQLIGNVRKLQEQDGGLHFEAVVSKTRAGDDTLELVRDGSLAQVSIGFRERPGGSRRTSNNVIQRTAADLFEVALVVEGAYGEQAELAGVRSINPQVAAEHGCTCCSELAQLRSAAQVIDLSRYALPPLP